VTGRGGRVPDDDGVHLAGEAEGLLQARPLGSGPAGGVGEDPIAPGLGQGIVLEVEPLVGSGDARVADEHGTLRSPIVPKPVPHVKLRDFDFGMRSGTDFRPRPDRCQGLTRPSRIRPFSGREKVAGPKRNAKKISAGS
jgi:hypothetical protein